MELTLKSGLAVYFNYDSGPLTLIYLIQGEGILAERTQNLLTIQCSGRWEHAPDPLSLIVFS
jgi:hypothetical protein